MVVNFVYYTIETKPVLIIDHLGHPVLLQTVLSNGDVAANMEVLQN